MGEIKKSGKKKSAVLIYLLAVLWIFAVIQYIVAGGQAKESSVTGVFSDSEFSTTQFTIHCRGQYEDGYYTKEEKQEWLKAAAKVAGIPEAYIIESFREENTARLELKKEGKNASAHISFITMETPLSSAEINMKNYVDIVFTVEGKPEYAFYYKEKFESFFADEKVNGQVNVELKGEYDGELSFKEKDAVAKHLLEQIGAVEKEGEKTEDIYTIYAYSDGIKDYVMNHGDKVNINLAIAYNEEAGVTSIYVGCPVISAEY